MTQTVDQAIAALRLAINDEVRERAIAALTVPSQQTLGRLPVRANGAASKKNGAPKPADGMNKFQRAAARLASIQQYLLDHPGSSAVDIAAGLSLDVKKLSNDLAALKKSEKIVSEGKTRATKWSAAA